MIRSPYDDTIEALLVFLVRWTSMFYEGDLLSEELAASVALPLALEAVDVDLVPETVMSPAELLLARWDSAPEPLSLARLVRDHVDRSCVLALESSLAAREEAGEALSREKIVGRSWGAVTRGGRGRRRGV